MRRAVVGLIVALVSTVLATAGSQAEEAVATDGRDDVTVIAVVDGSFQPQHLNWYGSTLPQHNDADPSNDLPLGQSPETWVPGFSRDAGIASVNALPLTIDEDPERSVASLQTEDAEAWSSMQQSTAGNVNYYWVPDTKVIGAVHFGSSAFRGANNAHGAGTSSVAAGNIHGTCPECVVVLVTYGGNDQEAASNWAMSQPWIDVVTNSFGFSQVERERLYSGSDTELQRKASERGQTIFFSSGNGVSNTFTVPNSTLFSSQEGPDWIMTVGGTHPSGGQYTGAGKPADVAAPGGSYPSQYGSNGTVSSQGNFSGTSNATPVVAGTYARALYWARQRLDGPSKTQSEGSIATGTPVTCGAARPDCELGDGVLTATELRTRLLHGAVRTPEGANPGGYANVPVASEEYDFAAEGHGTYFGKLRDDGTWQEEHARVISPMDGTAAALARTQAERDWMAVDSYCRQQIWGAWAGGYWKQGQALAGPSPSYPLRTLLASTCDQMFPPV